jgi:hypothetical protein
MDTPMAPANARAIVQEELTRFTARLQWREDDIRLAAVEALMERHDDRVSMLLPTIRELSAFRTAMTLPLPVATDAAEIPSTTHPLPRSAPAAAVGYRMFGLRARLAGVTIRGRTDACTFADAMQALDCCAVAELNLTANHCPLVSRERQRPPFGRYRHRMQLRRRGEWYIVTHSSTARKADLLREIARRLGRDLVVETAWMSTS